MDFSFRHTERELMDDPQLEKEILARVLLDINKVNQFLGGYQITIRAVAQLIKEFPLPSYTFVDVGCGDGSMLRKVAEYCRKQGISASFTGVDLSAHALEIAEKGSVSFPEITYLKHDILTLTTASVPCDILLCTLTMHHFSNPQIPQFLKRFVALARIGIVINDLQRSRMAYYLFKGFSAIFMRMEIARHDGLISIRSGFTKVELEKLAAGVTDVRHRIQWKWAFRYLWVMRKIRLKTANE